MEKRTHQYYVGYSDGKHDMVTLAFGHDAKPEDSRTYAEMCFVRDSGTKEEDYSVDLQPNSLD